MRSNLVGTLRQQSAFQNSSTPVVLVTDDPELKKLLNACEIVEMYPDTADHENGDFNNVFKIKVRRKEATDIR